MRNAILEKLDEWHDVVLLDDELGELWVVVGEGGKLAETILSALPHCAVLEAPVFLAGALAASSPRHHKLRNPATDFEVALVLRVLKGWCLLCRDCATAAHRYNAVKAFSDLRCHHLGQPCSICVATADATATTSAFATAMAFVLPPPPLVNGAHGPTR
ncbi:hypothetical protein E2562_029883 [Oryza meyeriana var. granulata]|uniref:Uncharacterized protein n=1 Tax=Oryza meyeriana var. granulata TaxID=110450 RepID=A0A6G1CT10_9ORYZ|nr:hypothetical protein E2562_029883 [Oryza meyeriana var. granulata]